MNIAAVLLIIEVGTPLVTNRSQFFAPTVSVSKPKPKRGAPRRSGPSAKAIAKRLERERAAVHGADYVLIPQLAMSFVDWLSISTELEGLSRVDQIRILEELWAEFIEHRKKDALN